MKKRTVGQVITLAGALTFVTTTVVLLWLSTGWVPVILTLSLFAVFGGLAIEGTE